MENYKEINQRVDLSLATRRRTGAQPFVFKLVYLHVDEISFSYKSMGTKTRCLKETSANSEMAY